MAELLVRRAEPSDLEAAVMVITEVSAWLAAKDISWLIDFPGPFPERIAMGEVFLAYLEDWDTLAATFSLGREPDVELWDGYPGQACYVHRLAVVRKFARRGIGATLLDLAGHLTAAEDLPLLRLDCHKNNLLLQNYYRRQGFDHLGTVDLPHRISGALFERPAKLVPSIIENNHGRFTIPLLSTGAGIVGKAPGSVVEQERQGVG